jgi:ankyrin repeat protein
MLLFFSYFVFWCYDMKTFQSMKRQQNLVIRFYYARILLCKDFIMKNIFIVFIGCAFLSSFVHAAEPQFPLHDAVRVGDTILVVELLKNNDVNQQDKSGKTPMHCAIAEGNKEMVRILLSAGAKTNIVDYAFWGPLHHAVYAGHEEIVKMMLNIPVDIDACDASGSTPIFRAIQNKQFKIVDLLLSAHANLNVHDNDAITPLHLAVGMNNCEGLILAKKLLCAGADVNEQFRMNDWRGQTVLHIAVEHGNSEMVELLLHANANTEAKDQQGRTPLQIAGHMFFYEIVRAFLFHKTLCRVRQSMLFLLHAIRLSPSLKNVEFPQEKIYKKIYEYLKEDARLNMKNPIPDTPNLQEEKNDATIVSESHVSLQECYVSKLCKKLIEKRKTKPTRLFFDKQN